MPDTTNPQADAVRAVARVRQMADAWEQRLPDTIRTATAVDAIRHALEGVIEETPADRAALRERIAAVVQRCAEEGDVRYGHIADAVLSVLPAATGRAAECPQCSDRAAVDVDELRRIRYENLRRAERAEAAMERVRSVLESEAVVGRSALDYRGLIASALMAGEAQQPETQAQSGCAHRGPHPGFTCDEVDASQPYFNVRWDNEQAEAQGALLATRCDACRHTLNWHRNDVGCTVALCVCSRFQPPTA